MTVDDKRRRGVSDEERALWRSVTRSVAPLRRHKRQTEQPADSTAASPNPVRQSQRLPSLPLPAPAVAAPKRMVAKPKEPALAPLDRRSRQRLARGSQEIDARLDLHGRTQSQAHAALLRFLHRAQRDGAKTVLVITGKGSGAEPAERGVLKRHVPLWLALPEFRSLVVGFGDAAITHGGAGALYVRVRRVRAVD